MTFRVPYRSDQHAVIRLGTSHLSTIDSSNNNNNPRMTDYAIRRRQGRNEDDAAKHRRRPNRQLSLYDDDFLASTIRKKTESTLGYRDIDDNDTGPSDQNTVLSNDVISKYKVSEIVNPDGSVTTRNLIIHADGNWEGQQQIQDYRGTKSRIIVHKENKNIKSDVPQLLPATSFESCRSSTTTSSSTLKTNKSELSEAGAHELRRQRLAKARALIKDKQYLIPLSPPRVRTTPSVSQETLSCSPKSQVSSESSEMMRLMRSPSNKVESPPRPKHTAKFTHHKISPNKHVAFLEPHSNSVDTTSLSTPPLEDDDGMDLIDETSSNDLFAEGDNDADSMGYPILDGHSFYSAVSDEDEESSIFRDVNVSPVQEVNAAVEKFTRTTRPPSPQGNGKIDEILGPLPTKSNSDSINDATRKQISQKTIGDTHRNETGEEVDDESPFIHVVTVHKISQQEKIGMYVGLRRFSYGTRLVVSRIVPDGKFANSGVELGDIVMSINGKSFLENPSSKEAFDVVKAATDRVTFVVQKQVADHDYQSISGTTISSVSKDFSSTVDIRSTSGDNRSKDISTEREESLNGTGRKMKRKMTSDGSMIISKDTQLEEPVPFKANESWKLSGAIVVGVKKSPILQKPGIRMGIKESLTGRVLYVAHIDTCSPFARTPLRVGDVIVSINNVHLRENSDVVDAYAALGKSGDEITIVAQKAEESLKEFLYGVLASQGNASNGSNVVTSEGYKDNGVKDIRKSLEFNENPHEAAGHGYNSSKTIFLEKRDSAEDVGIGLIIHSTQVGEILTVANVAPQSKAKAAGVHVGDAILSINGVDFRNDPDVERAMTLMKRARQDLAIEIQQVQKNISDRNIPEERQNVVIEQENVGVVRTRTFDSNDDFLHQTGSLKISGNALPTSEEEKVNESSLTIEASNLKSQRDVKRFPTEQRTDKNALDRSRLKVKHRKLWVSVSKEYQRQKIGISFVTLNNKLLITKVSPSGMLRAAPVLPGDTILSINRVDFRIDPDVEHAFNIITTASSDVTFEILKTGYAIQDDTVGHSMKSCFSGKFRCGRNRQGNQSVYKDGGEKKDRDDDTLSMSVIESHDPRDV